MDILREKDIPTLPELLKDIGSLKEFKAIISEHLVTVEELIHDEFNAYDDPMRYIEMKDYIDTISEFMKLLK